MIDGWTGYLLGFTCTYLQAMSFHSSSHGMGQVHLRLPGKNLHFDLFFTAVPVCVLLLTFPLLCVLCPCSVHTAPAYLTLHHRCTPCVFCLSFEMWHYEGGGP